MMLNTLKDKMAYRLTDYRDKIQFYIDLYSYCSNIKLTDWQSQCPPVAIPKVIHYCWFGRGEYSSLIKKCMATWQRVLPDYEFVLWNEDNFPIEKYPFAQEAYDKKKYAFTSDVARLAVLYEHGGIYLDTDIEMLKSFDPFLSHRAFTGFETYGNVRARIQSGVMGAVPHHPWIELLLRWYEGKHFSGYATFMPNTRIISKIIGRYYRVKLDGQPMVLDGDVHIYPAAYFCPGKQASEQSCCIHHFIGSWFD